MCREKNIYSFANSEYDVDLELVKHKLPEFTSDTSKVTEQDKKDFDNNIFKVGNSRFNNDLVLKTPSENVELKKWCNSCLVSVLNQLKKDFLDKSSQQLANKNAKAIKNFLENSFDYLTLLNYRKALDFVKERIQKNNLKCFIPLFNETVFEFEQPQKLEQLVKTMIQYFSQKEEILSNKDALESYFENLPFMYLEWSIKI